MDFAIARNNMVDSQIHPNGITSLKILEAMRAIAREAFVPEDKKALAYADEAIEIAPGRYMLSPLQLARLLKAAEIDSDDVVLLAGAGAGYATAVAAHLAQAVLAVEEDEQLADRASDLLAELDVTNAVILNAPHAHGAEEEAPFDVVLINGAIPAIPQNLLDQIKDGGRLACILLENGYGHVVTVTRSGDCFCQTQGPACHAPLLAGFDRKNKGFEF